MRPPAAHPSTAVVTLALVGLVVGACRGKKPPGASDTTGRTAAPTASAGATTAAIASDPASDSPPPAPGPGGIEYYPAALLAHVADELARGPTTTRTIGAHPAYHYVEARRAVNGVPEVHDRWVDVVIVQAGRARLVTGGRVDGGHLASPGEHRGGTIVGGAVRPIAPGDLVVIPAGVPHQYQVARGDSVRYLTIKVLQPAGGR